MYEIRKLRKYEHQLFRNFVAFRISYINDYLFPIFCLGCNREGVWVCEACFMTIGRAGVHACPVCRASAVDGSVCGACASTSVLAAERAVGEYHEGSLLGRLIHTFKYDYVESVEGVIEKIVQPYLINHRGAFTLVDLVVPVPLHPRRYAERGFNQAQLIGRIVSKVIERPVVAALRRRRYTQVQARLSREERIENVRAAFRLKGQAEVAGKKILLVDDVYTTGSTMQECARVLRAAGAVQVAGFTLARG